MNKEQGSDCIERFKNPALSRVNGILTAYCCVCGEYIGNEYDTSYYSLIRRKYCKDHAKEYRDIQMAITRRTSKAKKQKTVREMQTSLDEAMKTLRMQQDYIKSLQREIDDLKRSNLK